MVLPLKILLKNLASLFKEQQNLKRKRWNVLRKPLFLVVDLNQKRV